MSSLSLRTRRAPSLRASPKLFPCDNLRHSLAKAPRIGCARRRGRSTAIPGGNGRAGVERFPSSAVLGPSFFLARARPQPRHPSLPAIDDCGHRKPRLTVLRPCAATQPTRQREPPRAADLVSTIDLPSADRSATVASHATDEPAARSTRVALDGPRGGQCCNGSAVPAMPALYAVQRPHSPLTNNTALASGRVFSSAPLVIADNGSDNAQSRYN